MTPAFKFQNKRIKENPRTMRKGQEKTPKQKHSSTIEKKTASCAAQGGCQWKFSSKNMEGKTSKVRGGMVPSAFPEKMMGRRGTKNVYPGQIGTLKGETEKRKAREPRSSKRLRTPPYRST